MVKNCALISKGWESDFSKSNVIVNYLHILESGKKTFYASDLDLNGGQINGLSYWNFIKKTGNKKEVWIDIDESTKKRSIVYEWEVIDYTKDTMDLTWYNENETKVEYLTKYYSKTLEELETRAKICKMFLYLLEK